MPIESRVYLPAQLTVHEVYGGISPKDFRETLHTFYEETGPTRDVLWDVRKAAWDMVPATSMLDAIAAALQIYRDHLGPRSGGKTAIIVSDDLGFGFATLGQMLVRALKPPIPFEIRVFSDLAAGNDWLQNSRQDG